MKLRESIPDSQEAYSSLTAKIQKSASIRLSLPERLLRGLLILRGLTVPETFGFPSALA